jgi:hypothetical protein
MPPFTLNLLQGSISFQISLATIQNLQQEIAVLMTNLKSIASRSASGGGKPKPQPAMEYRYAGDIFLEVFCNPNIYPSPFAAKVLITVRDDKIKITSEAELTRLLEDINLYLEANGD